MFGNASGRKHEHSPSAVQVSSSGASHAASLPIGHAQRIDMIACPHGNATLPSSLSTVLFRPGPTKVDVGYTSWSRPASVGPGLYNTITPRVSGIRAAWLCGHANTFQGMLGTRSCLYAGHDTTQPVQQSAALLTKRPR